MSLAFLLSCVLCLCNPWPLRLCLSSLILPYLCKCMKQDPAWKAGSSSAGQEIAYILWNLKVHFPCEVPGFRREVDENCALLGCYSASSGEFLRTFRDNLSVPYSKGQESKMLTPGDGTDRLSRNVCKKLTLLAA